MTTKQKILRMVERLPDDVSYDRVIYHLHVMKGIEIGLQQAARGEGIDHDEFFDQLLAEECHEPKSSGHPKRKRTSNKFGDALPATPHARRRRTRTE